MHKAGKPVCGGLHPLGHVRSVDDKVFGAVFQAHVIAYDAFDANEPGADVVRVVACRLVCDRVGIVTMWVSCPVPTSNESSPGPRIPRSIPNPRVVTSSMH